MRVIEFHGLTRQGRDRHENQDGFGAYPDLGLFVVVDARGSARAATLTLEAFERTVAEALRAENLDGALTAAARLAHESIQEQGATDPLLREAGAEFAALLIHDDGTRIAWSGNCRVYRTGVADMVDVLSARRWDPEPATCIGSDRFEMCERFTTTTDGCTFLLATDGFHHLSLGFSAHGLREDVAEALGHAPLEQLGVSLMDIAGDRDDSAVLLVRF